MSDHIGWHALWRIEKYHGAPVGEPFAVDVEEHNLGLNEGLNLLTTLLCGGAGTDFGNTNAYLGVGDSNTAAAATQTGLQAATNKLYKAMDEGYPTYGTSQQIVWRSTFATDEANFAWEERTVANGNSDAATNLNRKVSSKGTKQSGDTWTLTLTITFS